MSFHAKLYVDGMEFNILQHNFGFLQKSDYNGRPTAKPQSETFDFTIEASKDNTFFEWAIDPKMMKKECEIVFSSVQGNGKSTKIKLLDVYCTFCEYHFSSTGSNPFKESFSLSPATILVDGQVMMSKHWKVTDPNINTPVTVREEAEKKVTNYFLTDKDGNEIQDYESGQIIVLNIETENRTGDKISIKLYDQEHDFKYLGKVLDGDTIQNIVIGNSLEQIQLEVIDQVETA